jgi:hypothetical protein
MRYGSPASVISCPYLSKRIRSPPRTATEIRRPSSFSRPLPTAMTSPVFLGLKL